MAQSVRLYNLRAVDELILWDIEARARGQGPNLAAISRCAAVNFVPLTYGGGIRNADDAVACIQSGADKVSVRSLAVDNAKACAEISLRLGCQALVVVVDYRESGSSVLSRAKSAVEDCGAGEIVVQNQDRDGNGTGYDCRTLEKVVGRVDVPTVASGGLGVPTHAHEAILAGADAVAGSSVFHFTSITPKEIRECLAEHGWPVRAL
jgi:cyclase